MDLWAPGFIGTDRLHLFVQGLRVQAAQAASEPPSAELAMAIQELRGRLRSGGKIRGKMTMGMDGDGKIHRKTIGKWDNHRKTMGKS